MVERESLMLKTNQNNICPSYRMCILTLKGGDEWSLPAFASTSRDKNWPCKQLKK